MAERRALHHCTVSTDALLTQDDQRSAQGSESHPVSRIVLDSIKDVKPWVLDIRVAHHP
jgi:hypothetical protein